MLEYKLTVGLLPIRRDLPDTKGIFGWCYADKNKNDCIKFIRQKFEDDITSFVDIDFLNDEGLLYKDSDCDKVAEYFKQKGVNALVIINCNFGNENCAGLVAKKLNVPTLLWGPRDTNFSNESRYTDTQCGLFAMGNQLNHYGIKFTYIPSCDIDDSRFSKEFGSFLSVATMVKNFKEMKILSVGARIRPFKSVMYNELELVEKFGVDVVTLNLADALKRLNNIWDTKQKELDEDLAELKTKYKYRDPQDDENLKRVLCYVYYFEEIVKEYGSNVICSECWTGLKFGWHLAYPCLAMSILADRNIYVTCESDMHMTITNLLLLSASRGKGKPIQGEFTTINPDNPNSELIWHCGPFPLSCKDDACEARLLNNKPAFKLKDGEYTIARFQVEKGKYYLLGGKYTTCDGPKTFGTYMWAQFKNLPKLEKKIVEGPYIHHMTEMMGDYVNELQEFTKYVDVVFDPLED